MPRDATLLAYLTTILGSGTAASTSAMTRDEVKDRLLGLEEAAVRPFLVAEKRSKRQKGAASQTKVAPAVKAFFGRLLETLGLEPDSTGSMGLISTTV